jgi:CRISPR-associated endonuclease/helicase Cas3
MTSYFANSNGQDLEQHLKAVAWMCRYIYRETKFDLPNNSNAEMWCYLAGFFHDLGKFDPAWQAWCQTKMKKEISIIPDNGEQEEEHPDDSKKEKTWDEIVRHNELSWMIMQHLNLRQLKMKPVEYAVLWHHAKKVRKEKTENGKNKNQELKVSYKTLHEYYHNADDYSNILNIVSDFLRNTEKYVRQELGSVGSLYDSSLDEEPRSVESPLPDFLEVSRNDFVYSDLNVKNIIRCCLISADRWVSSLTKEQIENLFNSEGFVCEAKVKNMLNDTKNNFSHSTTSDTNALVKSVENMLDLFRAKFATPDGVARNEQQSQAANEAYETSKDYGCCVLQAPAGAGKTKIALEYISKTKSERAIFVCPRVQVCLSDFDEICKLLPNVSVQIWTGSDKRLYANGEIVNIENDNDFLTADINITTIDQTASLMTSHLNFPKSLELLKTTIVFDEPHEIISTEAIFPFLKQFIIMRNSMQNNHKAHTLFMTATPNLALMEELLNY